MPWNDEWTAVRVPTSLRDRIRNIAKQVFSHEPEHVALHRVIEKALGNLECRQDGHIDNNQSGNN